MRIVHIEAGRHLYGGAVQVGLLLDGLRVAGHAPAVENVLVCARGAELASVVHGERVIELDLGGEADVTSIARLRRVLSAVRPDLVHVHSRRGADLWGGVAAALAGLPAVLTRRVDAVEPSLWLRLKYRPYRAIVALSRAIERQLAAAGVTADRVVRIPSAVDSERFRPDPAAPARLRAVLGWPLDALVIGVVAQLIPRKGHAALLAALPDLVRRHPTLRVACFGRGPLESRLRHEIAARGLGDRVRLLGFRRDLPQLLPGLDVLAHPAEREGLGVALLEAASCGVPAVATAIGGIPDVIEHERTGLLATDARALAPMLDRLLASREQRVQLGAAARAHVLREFSVAALGAAHLRLYAAVRSEPACDASNRPRSLIEGPQQ